MKKIILKSITYVMGFIFLLSIAALDSEPFYIPLIMVAVSGCWLGLMAWANGFFY